MRNPSRSLSFVRSHLPTSEEWAVLRVQVPLFLAVSTLLSVGYYAQRALRAAAERDHVQIILRGWDGFAWFAWLLAAPVILMLIRRFPLTRGRLTRSITGLVAGSMVLYFCVTNLRFLLRVLPNMWLPPSDDVPVDWSNYTVTLLVLMPLDFLTYGAFFAASLAINYYIKFRQRAEEALQLELHTAQLQSDLARAELTALRGQLHPHFLFNSFNAVVSLVRQRRNDAAVEVIAQLSALLRLAIDRTGQQELSLDDEMDFIRRYLEIEQVRFGEKLQTRFDCDPEALSAAVPNLLLQPLVENAIKHGISRRTRPGAVGVSALRAGERLVLEITDDGPDAEGEMMTAPAKKSGIGLTNTRARLDKLYGSDYRLDIRSRAGGGTQVRLDLPWRPMPLPKPA